MPKSFTGSGLKDFYKDLLQTNNGNTGVSSTIKQIFCGDGDDTSLFLSDRNFKVRPSADSTSMTSIQDSDGNALFTIDSTNDLLKAGIGQHIVNSQFANFGVSAGGSAWAGASANTHYAVPFNSDFTSVLLSIGTGTNPDTTYTVATTADDLTGSFMFLSGNITVDNVTWFCGADASSGDTVRAHLMSYDIDVGNGSTGGDLTNGTVVADGSDIVGAGYEQVYYQQMTIQNANVNANKVLMFVFRADTVSSDYTINATIKYHLR